MNNKHDLEYSTYLEIYKKPQPLMLKLAWCKIAFPSLKQYTSLRPLLEGEAVTKHEFLCMLHGKEWEELQYPQRNITEDIKAMMKHYNFKSDDLTPTRFGQRLGLLEEEYGELITALNESNSEEVVDALIDLVVIAIGTLELLNVDVNRAWTEVHTANMAKERGAKEGRPSDGWDLRKPEGWVAPSHEGNHGKLPQLLSSISKPKKETK